MNDFLNRLAGFLTKTSTLETLEFWEISFSAKFVQAISKGLANNKSIRELVLTKCKISAIDLEILSVGAGSCCSLNLLNLSGNELQGPETIRAMKNIITRHSERKNEIVWAASLRGEKPKVDPNSQGTQTGEK